MGRKITIDSATLVNKAFEVIEAHWLFGVPYERIDTVLHRQSVVHSFVEFIDGSVKAQVGPPDMRYPIQYALFYPERRQNKSLPSFNPVTAGDLTFEYMDPDRYPCFRLALEAAQKGGTWPAVVTSADAAAVELFLNGRIRFTDIPDRIESVLAEHEPTKNPSLEEILCAATWATELTLDGFNHLNR
jgi:1-deoxy-D-xylulose-5-phosphate reductoisomerase